MSAQGKQTRHIDSIGWAPNLLMLTMQDRADIIRLLDRKLRNGSHKSLMLELLLLEDSAVSVVRDAIYRAHKESQET